MVVMGNYKMCEIFKTAGRRAKRSKIWASVVSTCIYCIRGILTAKCSNLFLRSPGAFQFFRSSTTLYLEND